ncbi:ADP-ribosylation factor-related protein 1 [Echinococcus granulosus]|nr:ADP-ribosylation factor-related protein 1 [Echinococcus granulosus]
MYTLIRGFCRQIVKKDEYSVLILGLDQAGKTTYLEQAKTKFNENYKSIPLHKITSTVGLNIGQIALEGIIMKFWDLGDKMIQNHALEGVPLLIIANKQDLDFAFPVSEIRQVFQDSAHLIGSRDCSMRGASALKGDGVIDAIRWMAEKIKKNSIQRPPNVE